MRKGKLGFGIIGCGVIAPTHVEAIGACPEAELVAVCDIDEPKGRAFAAAHGAVPFYANYRDMLKDPAVDAVCVCTPSGLHADCAIAAARAGRHILCEKPLDIRRDRMSRMLDEVDRARVTLGCVFQSRTVPDYIRARRAVQKGILGTMTLADAFLKDYRSRAYYASAGWRGTWALDGGGALMNQGVHGVDILMWIADSEVDRVFARADHKVRDIEVEDTCVAALQYRNGAFGTLIGTTSCNPGETRRIEVHGDLGTIICTGSTITRWAVATEPDGRAKNLDQAQQTVHEGTTGDNKALTAQGHAFLLADLVQAIQTGREPYITGQSARKAVDLILAIYQSARQRRDVAVKYG